MMDIQASNLPSLPMPAGKLPDLLRDIIHTRRRHEVKVEANLTRKGRQTFLPRVTVRSRRRDRRQTPETHLFHEYLFVRTNLNEGAHNHIIRTQGVVRILGAKGQCTPVPEEPYPALMSFKGAADGRILAEFVFPGSMPGLRWSFG